MDYTNDDSVHPLVPAPHSSGSSSRRKSSAHPSSSSSQNNYYTFLPAIQPQQHQQLLKLKSEHDFSSASVPLPENAGMAHSNISSEDMDERSTRFEPPTMTATLPRSALQEETIALFKQCCNLIPCAKFFCRNANQHNGMSDGNLRSKCLPPVSMSLICNKSYSESKIRNMIVGVVYATRSQTQRLRAQRPVLARMALP
ncbi:hypothetical protein BGZ47_010849 [Haplosporangium gracile]|nr:hypothetical protein BGZ47_010849 [Haplosporangium gracile]